MTMEQELKQKAYDTEIIALATAQRVYDLELKSLENRGIN